MAHKHIFTAPSERKGKAPFSPGRVASGSYRGSTEQRINFIANTIENAVIRFPDLSLAAIENHAFGAVGQGKTILAELHGVVKNRLLRAGIPYVVLSPVTVKVFATGSAGASKVDMIDSAKKFFPECFDGDRADAYWIARVAASEMEPF